MKKVKKYKLTNDTIEVDGRKLYRIKALIDIDGADVKKGDLGGYIEKEENLSHSGNAWVCGNARVCGDAWVCGNARVCDKAWVCGDALVCGNARVCDDADYTTIKGFGTEYRTTTFFRCEDNTVKVACGCFFGTIPEFREQVKKTREGKLAEEYLMIADLMEKHFDVESEGEVR